MDDPQLRSDLALYRATGDPRALSRVLEPMQGELLRAALRAVGERDAADLVQVTCLHAIASLDEFDGDRPLLPWLRGILEHRAHSLRRERARCPDPERLPSPPSVDPLAAVAADERAELLQRGLAELPERQRQAVTMRWLQGLPVREIAVAMDASVDSVKTWLQRGVARMRTLLPPGIGVALSMLLSSEAAATPTPVHEPEGGVRPTRRSAEASAAPRVLRFAFPGLVAVVIAAAGLATWLLAGLAEPAPEQRVAGIPIRQERQHPEVGSPSTETRVLAAVPAAAPAAAPVTEPTAGRLVRGRVVDSAGAPVAMAKVSFEPGRLEHDPRGLPLIESRDAAGSATATAVAGRADGTFTIVVPSGVAGILRATTAELAPVIGRLFDESTAEPREVELVVARARNLSGTVHDVPRGGPPVVQLRLPEALVARYLRRCPARELWLFEPWVEIDGNGGFSFDATAVLAGSHLVVHWSAGSQRVPLDSADPGWIDVHPTQPDAVTVVGQVLVDGRPGKGALVGCGPARTHCDDHGRFSLPPDEYDTRLWAVLPGRLPATVPLLRDVSGAVRLPQPVTLRIEERSRSIRGRVRWEDGAPAAGVAVFATDPEPAGTVPATLFLESYLAPKGEVPFRVHTDEDGSFELPYLGARSYRVAALDPKTLVRVVSEPSLAGGGEIELVLDRSAAALVRGRIVTRDGVALPTVQFVVCRQMIDVPFMSGRLRASYSGPVARTDDEGRFSVTLVDGDDLYVRVRADYTSQLPCRMRRVDGRGEVAVVVTRQIAVRVMVDNTNGRVDALEFRDAADRTVAVWRGESARAPTMQRPMRRISLSSNLAPGVADLQLLVSEGVTSAVLLRNKRVVARQPAPLVVGRDNLLQF
ncbi:MAG: sigma-70 family RNA polymerase sigma factor [bacterium]|nr:sigma-70 family RNA polymerase sigma factor [bacterium]